MVVSEWFDSCSSSREEKYRVLLDAIRYMGTTRMAGRLEFILNSGSLSGFRSPAEQYLRTVENPKAGTPFRNETKPQNESLSDSLSFEGNYDGEDPIITLSRSKGKDMTISGVKIDSFIDTSNPDYNRLATFRDSDNVYISYLDQFADNTYGFKVATGKTYEMDTIDIFRVADDTGIMDDQKDLVVNQSGVMDDQTGVMIDQTGVMNDLKGKVRYQTGVLDSQIGIMIDQTGVVDGQIGKVNDQTGVVTDQTGVVDDKTGVVNDQTGIVDGQTGVMNDQAGVVNGQTGVVNDQTGIVDDQTGIVDDQTGVVNDQTGVTISKAGVANEQLSEVPVREYHHDNRNAVNQNDGKYQTIFSSCNFSFEMGKIYQI